MMYTPDKKLFLEKAKQGNLIPVWRELLVDFETPVSAYKRLRTALRRGGEPSHTFLFESVEGGEHIARFSFWGGQPRALFKASGRSVEIVPRKGETECYRDVEPLSVLKTFMSRYQAIPDPRLPRFFGGAVGYIGYDAVAQFDKVPIHRGAGLGWPDIFFQITDTLVIFDRVRHTVKVVANASIEDDDAGQAYTDALARIDLLCEYLRVEIAPDLIDVYDRPRDEVPFTSNTDHDAFIEAVDRAKEYIRAGDIIQVVLSQRFAVPRIDDPLDAYRALRSINPSPYMFCYEFGDRALVGASPEIHVRCEEGRVEVRPIAGTRPRSPDPEEDKRLVEELLADPKEKAEHIMLVDLGRNDIGRVCEYGSVHVPEFMTIERYSHVMHIVSDVAGTLARGRDAYDVMRATFPAGTLSGAPKIRAMEIIAELENAPRGPYGGAVGYFSFNGNLDSCITIRTILLDGDAAYIQAGAGIVADSNPEAEYEETLNKAKGMLKAMGLAPK